MISQCQIWGMAEASVKKKSGGAKTEDYEDEAFIQSLEPLSKKLQEQFPNGKWDSRAVSQFAAQAQQLTEDVLGIKVSLNLNLPKGRKYARLIRTWVS